MKLSKEIHKLKGSLHGYMKEHAGDEMGKEKSVKHKALKGGHKQGEREVRSKKAGFYVAGHKNYGDVYEA